MSFTKETLTHLWSKITGLVNSKVNQVQADIDDIKENYATKEEVGENSVGKFYTEEDGSIGEIFNDYTNNKASGDYSHAEGYNTTASGHYSHVQGFYTTVNGNYQTVMGKYNIEDTPDENGNGKYALIIGNGTNDNNRSNCFAVDWEGNIITPTGMISMDLINSIASNIVLNTSSIGLSRKNLLKNTTGTKTESGVLFTVNADGSVTAKRTETSESNSYYLINKISLKKGKYIFTGGNSDDRNIPYILIYTYKADNTYIGAISGNTVFEVTDETMKYGFNINYPLGNTKAVTFYPMLRYADVADDTYAPYVDDLQTQINKNDNDIAITQSSIGLSKKNLLKVTGTTQKVDDVTFTVNDDMSITVSGKNTSDTTAFYRITNSVSLPIGKTYKLSGCPTNNKDADGKAMAYWRVEKQALVVAMDTGDSKTFTTTTSTNPTMAQICVYAGADFTDNPITFYPMIRYSDVTDDTYEQYTPSLQEQINDILARLTALEG